jgi:hypothetical protein
MQQAAFDRGSFATLLDVVFSADWRAVRIVAIGDSILAFLDKQQVIRTIPYESPDEFEHAPELLSTNLFENRSLDILNAWHELHLASQEAPALLLMTDATWRWLMDDQTRAVTLLSICDDQSFASFVEQERAQTLSIDPVARASGLIPAKRSP